MTSNAVSTEQSVSRASTMDVEAQKDGSSHRLASLRLGESEIEQLAHRIESTRAERIKVTQDVRKTFLKTCRKIARERGCSGASKIPLEDLIALRDEYRVKVEEKREKGLIHIIRALGFYDTDATMLEVLERGVKRATEVDGDYLYYQDFSFYYTKVESMWPWMRNSLSVAVMVMLMFYLLTPIFFCSIVKDNQVCPADPDGNRWYYGWLTSLYFASTTMSTVGYGDVTVEKNTNLSIFYGILYMIASVLVAMTAFSAAAERAVSPIAEFNKRVLGSIPALSSFSKHFMSTITGDLKEDELLYKRVGRMRLFALTEVTLQFVSLNLFGVFVARIFVLAWHADKAAWTWMTTFYWAVQTTTTIGYGDLDMPFEFRWFQIIFLTLGTYFVGNVLGRLGNLNQEISEVTKRHAWKRREVSKGLIEDMQAYDHDDKVDQYEFVVASLLALGKINSKDIRPIMDKFREAAGDRGYIQLDEVTEGDDDSDDNDSSESFDEEVLFDCH